MQHREHPPPRAGGVVIARVWRGVVAAERLADYVTYVQDTGAGEYLRTPGNLAAYVLTRDLGDGRAELVAWSLWDDFDAIRGFAGEDTEAMVLYPEDEDFLLEPPTLVHYDVTEPHTDLEDTR